MNDRKPSSEQTSSEHTPAPPEARELPTGQLLELLAGDRALSGELNATSVPESLMEVVIEHAMSWLWAHGRGCRRPTTCPDTPSPLRFLLKLHSRDAMLRSAGVIHKQVWLRPDCTMVREIRDGILLENEDLATAADEGDLIASDSVRDHLRQGAGGVEQLAAVLWAVGLDDAARRELFRLLPAFISAADPPAADDAAPVKTATHKQESEKERHKRRRKAAESRVIDLEREVRELRGRGRERADEITRITAQYREQTAEVERLTAAADALAAERDHHQEDARRVQAQMRTIERDAARAQQANKRLRDELEEQRGEASRIERERGHLTRELALARTRIESLETALRAVPRGKDAVAAFLDEQEREIDEQLLIAQGADRVRAQDAHSKRERLEEAFRAAYPEYVPPRPTSVGATRSLRFTALGGGAEVGRSSYLVEIGSSRVLVDCGIAVGRREEDGMVPDLAAAGRLDAVVLTHAHTDHIGWLPALAHIQEPTVPIYCSEDTADITPIMLDDARGHYERMLAVRQQHARYNPLAEPAEEQYTRDDVYDVKTRLRALRYDDPLELPGTALSLTLFPAGHILGAASVLLEGGGRRVFLSGDISSEDQATVMAASPPRDIDDVDLLVLESTYGGQVREPAEVQRRELVDFVRETTKAGTAILPCFALGRGQEVLEILLQARKTGALDSAVTVWVDGLIRAINPYYIERMRLTPAGFHVVEPGDRALAIADCQRPDARAAVVTTSGMLNGGPVIEWADALLGDPRNRIALLGYQDEGSAGGALGRQLRQQARPPYELRLPREEGGELALRIAGPLRDIRLSAHADENGLVAFAKAVPARRTVLVHGDPRAQAALSARLARELPATSVSTPGSQPLAIT
jgi:Cft2 family RNA processing exonuclease